MNKLFTKRFRSAALLMTVMSSFTFAQLSNVDFLRAGAADGTKIIQAYLAPWANAFGAGLNGSWYNSAKPHKLGGFDITTAFNIGFVPASAGTFNVGDLGLTTLTGSGTASTVSGPNTAGPTLTKTVSGITLASFTLPPGTNWKIIPVPMAQIGVGLPMGTELKFRYIPKLSIKDGDISLWGVGLMHSIMQHIPGSKLLPVDVSLFGGYTKLQGNVPLNLQPGTPVNYTTYNTPGAFSTQNMNASVTAWNLSLLGSLNIPLLTVYGGLGYSKTITDIKLTGNFPTPVFVATPAPHAEYNDTGVLSGSELPTINIKNFSGIRANLGARLKLGVITIHADYTRSQYNILSAGLGISFR
ncbi:MAG: hypothetical protein C0408_00075 [Odoribacter sp.]|nr:hypothetical protein [Odoribacter sp.]